MYDFIVKVYDEVTGIESFKFEVVLPEMTQCGLACEGSCLIWTKSFRSVIRHMTDDKGNDASLSGYKGKVLLTVNVASKCGLTNSNYTELNQLYEKYREQGLEILAFPCDQFGTQEPGTRDEIKLFVCTRFKSEFPVFDKTEVNEENTAPLFKFLKSGKWGMFEDDIQWNFAKFLVDKNGVIAHRYYPTTDPLSLEGDIFRHSTFSMDLDLI